MGSVPYVALKPAVNQALTKNSENHFFPYVLVVLVLNFRNRLANASDISMP